MSCPVSLTRTSVCKDERGISTEKRDTNGYTFIFHIINLGYPPGWSRWYTKITHKFFISSDANSGQSITIFFSPSICFRSLNLLLADLSKLPFNSRIVSQLPCCRSISWMQGNISAFHVSDRNRFSNFSLATSRRGGIPKRWPARHILACKTSSLG